MVSRTIASIERTGLGTLVECTDGSAGELRNFLIDSTTGQVTDLVVRRGFVVTRDVVVPVDAVTKVTRDRIVLGLTREQLDQRPEYRSDEEIASAVEQTLWDDDLIRRSDISRLSFAVRDGIVTLRGPVVSDTHRSRAESVVRRVPGVRGVLNELVADEDLEIAVAQALGRDPRTQHRHFLIRAEHGVIYLSSDVPFGEASAAAPEVAAGVPGVREVRVDTHRVEYA